MKKRQRKKNNYNEEIIDLSKRKNIEIISFKSKPISDNELAEFQIKLDHRYKEINEFTNTCISKHFSKFLEESSEKEFKESIEHLFEQFELLDKMIEQQIKNDTK